jgi:hypothetical protein
MGKKSKLSQAHQLADDIATALGDNLVSLVLYGANARRGYSVGHDALNLMLVVRNASTTALRPIQPLLADWVKLREPPPLIVTEQEWKGSTDVFPIEIEDMRDAHELLKGMDPFAGLETTAEDLRQELEREIRGKLLQLRSEYAAVAPDGKALTRLLLDSVTTFFVLMRALVRLVGGKPQAEPESLVQQAADAAQLDPSAFDWVVRKISGRTVQALTPYDPVGARYLEEIQKMAAFVDQFVHKRGAAHREAPGTSAGRSSAT